MRLLLDQGLPRTAAPLLNRHGHDVVHTGAVGLSEMDDPEILAWARAQSRSVVTLDADFHRHLAADQLRLPSVIRLRLEGLRAETPCPLLMEICELAAADLAEGAAVTVTEDYRCRIRRLPLVPRQPPPP
ncbi:MAG TPA: DUF5615 family PIN-like protein [Verrucomicrobiota bacterium]|nr:DUF5615 family PIN-like protein [Verrucomicrobiota bacterium]